MNKMKINKQRLANLRKAFNSIVIGTLAGLATYSIFLYFKIAIFGWNLGLLFAPLVAGYVETYIAKKLIGEGIGAISAFLLFLVTVIYGFIINNPTLGYNIITVGSIVIIVQAAIPTFINYFGIVVIVGTLSYIIGFFKKITDKIAKIIFNRPEKTIIDTIPPFNEDASNKLLNSQNFIFMTSTDPIHLTYENMGYFYTIKTIDKNERIINLTPEKVEKKHLADLKQGKDECLIKLANKIKSSGGNGVIDLEISYFLNGLGGSDFQIIARGTGIKIREENPAS